MGGCRLLVHLTAVLVPPTVPRAVVHANFAVYTVLNLILHARQRRHPITAGWVWLDIAANLVPMFGGLYWTGGVHSPLLPIFVLKLPAYGFIYGVDVGFQALGATILVGLYLTAADLIGLDLPAPVALVSDFGQKWVRLGFALVIYATLVGGALRLNRVAQEHEANLAETIREKELLYARAVAQQQALRQLSRRMMEVSEETLQRIARDLHDHLGQSLTAVRMEIGLIERGLEANHAQRASLESVRKQLAGLLQTVRDLSQLLRPPVLDDLGLVPALQSLVGKFVQQSQIDIMLAAPPSAPRLPHGIELALYRVVQEALTNMARHSRARHGAVEVAIRADAVALQISDDGDGFDLAQHRRSGFAGTGIIGIRERVAAHGGELTVESAPRSGTRPRLEIPLSLPDVLLEGAR